MANCQVFSASDFKVETCSDTIPCGFFGWDQPPLRSVFGEPDYLGQWKTQYRALVLEASLTQEHNAVHLNAIFFERVLQDRSHPVPHSDLFELGLQDHHLAVDHVPDEAKVFFAQLMMKVLIQCLSRLRIDQIPMKFPTCQILHPALTLILQGDVMILVDLSGIIQRGLKHYGTYYKTKVPQNFLKKGQSSILAPSSHGTFALVKKRIENFVSIGTIKSGHNKSKKYGKITLIICHQWKYTWLMELLASSS